MQHRLRLALILAIVIGLVVFSGVGIILRFAIRYNRSGAAQALREAELRAAREASRAHRRRAAQAQLPEAIPVETKAKFTGPALGNVIIKGTSALREFESELVRVEVPKKRPAVTEAIAASSSVGNSCGVTINPSESRVAAHEPGNGDEEEAFTHSPVMPSRSLSASAPGTDELSTFQDEIERGGYVIVECSQRSTGPPAAEASGEPGAGQESQVPSPTEATSAATPPRRVALFRHQTSSVMYGTARYYNSHVQAPSA